MKKLMTLLVVLAVGLTSTAVQASPRGGGNHGGRGGGHFAPPPVVPFLFGAAVGSAWSRPHVIYRSQPVVYGPQVYVTPAPYVGGLLPQGNGGGHWENVIVGYQWVTVPVHHSPVYGTYWNGYQNVQYVVREGWTEMVNQQQPIVRQIWVNN